MAENKKSFLMYCDFSDHFHDLTDEEAGQLIKHIFDYVNDKNPVAENRVIQIAFNPIKQSLKRDLVKWEEIKQKKSEAGKASAEARKAKQTTTDSTPVESVSKNATEPTVSVSVSDSVVSKDTFSNEEGFKNPNDIEVAYTDESEFLKDWIDARLHFDKKPTSIKKLDMREKSVFTMVNKSFKQDEIRLAIKGLFMQKNMYAATRLRPSHFLENIEKYLDCHNNKIQLFEDKQKEQKL